MLAPVLLGDNGLAAPPRPRAPYKPITVGALAALSADAGD